MTSRPVSPAALGILATAALACAVAAIAPAPAAAQTGLCTPDATTLCLLDGRFRVEVEWEDFAGNPLRLPGGPNAGAGRAVPLPVQLPLIDAGYLYFFDPDTIDLVVKMIDGRQINDRFWVFYGSLTNVEYTLRVTDTSNGEQKTYVNPPGASSAEFDTAAFPIRVDPRSAAAPTSRPSDLTRLEPARGTLRPAASLPSCADPEVACVQDGRFAIEGVLTSLGPDATQRVLFPTLETGTSALLTFDDGSSGPSVGVKVVDGRAVDGEFWLFATAEGGGELALTLTDLETGRSVHYFNEPGETLAVADGTPFVPDPPSDEWMETGTIPGFRFQVRVTGGGQVITTRQEEDCVPETLCVSAAIPGRSELFLRMVGPKPNGYLWPNLVKFSTSRIEVWIEQIATGQVNYYQLDAAGPGSSELTGFFDRLGFLPAS